jgi:hypothetical protein
LKGPHFGGGLSHVASRCIPRDGPRVGNRGQGYVARAIRNTKLRSAIL